MYTLEVRFIVAKEILVTIRFLIIGANMFKKLTPLIILAMFIVGTYFMIQGMNKATALAHPQKTEKK
jgi:hypothetical protein